MIPPDFAMVLVVAAIIALAAGHGFGDLLFSKLRVSVTPDDAENGSMTTTVTINAHCDSSTTKVRITQGDRDREEPPEISHIEDGESTQLVVYDSRYISVDEVPK